MQRPLVGLKGLVQETPLGVPYRLIFPDQALKRSTLDPLGSRVRQEMHLLSAVLGAPSPTRTFA